MINRTSWRQQAKRITMMVTVLYAVCSIFSTLRLPPLYQNGDISLRSTKTSSIGPESSDIIVSSSRIEVTNHNFNSTNSNAGSPTNNNDHHHNSSVLTSSSIESSIDGANIRNILVSSTNNTTLHDAIPISKHKHNSSNLTSSPSLSKASSYCPGCRWNRSTRQSCFERKQYVTRKSHGMDEKAIFASMRMHAPTCFIENIHFEQKQERFVVNEQAHKSSPGNGKRLIDPLRGTSGKWVKDWNYAKRAGYIHTNSLSEWGVKNQTLETALMRNATAWKWIDDHSPVTEISLDGFCKVCHHLDITRILIVGDSLARGFRQSLESLLGLPPGYPNANRLFEYITNQQVEIPCSQSANFSGVTIAFQRIKDLAQVKDVAASETPDFIANNPNRTALIFNIGVHMKNFAEYREGFDLMMAWFNSWKVDRSKLHAFFKESIPGHPNCTPGRNLDKNKRFQTYKSDATEPFKTFTEFSVTTQENMQAQMQMKNETSWKWHDFVYANGTIEQYNAYSKEVFDSKLLRDDELQVHWLNVYNSTVLRRDGHEGFGGKWLQSSTRLSPRTYNTVNHDLTNTNMRNNVLIIDAVTTT